MGEVDKSSIKLGKDRRVLAIGPSEIAPEQGYFHNPQVVNSIVEGSHEGVVDIVIVFLLPQTED